MAVERIHEEQPDAGADQGDARASSEPSRAEAKADSASRETDASARAELRDEVRGEIPGAERFEQVGDRVAETVSADRWADADRTEREAIAGEVNDVVRSEYGLPAQEAKIESLGGALGEYDPTDRSVHIDESLLDEDRPNELISTLAHENRHDLQQRVMDGDMPHPQGALGQRETDIWTSGVQGYQAAGDFADYAYNPLETDARAAESGVLTGWLEAELDRAREES